MKKVEVPIIQKSVETVYNLNSDTRVQELARIQEEADEMYISGMYNAEQRGIQQGIEKGVNDVIAKMKRSGMSDEQIQVILNL